MRMRTGRSTMWTCAAAWHAVSGASPVIITSWWLAAASSASAGSLSGCAPVAHFTHSHSAARLYQGCQDAGAGGRKRRQRRLALRLRPSGAHYSFTLGSQVVTGVQDAGAGGRQRSQRRRSLRLRPSGIFSHKQAQDLHVRASAGSIFKGATVEPQSE